MARFLPDTFEKFLRLTAITVVDVGVRYLIFAGLAWVLAYVLFRRHWSHRKIIPRQPLSTEMWREIRYSALTVVVFGLVGSLTILAARFGWTQLYFKLHQHSWTWFVTSIGLAIILHDTYFYWTHRLMHHRLLFRHFHRVHHLSQNPSPWASYSFAPLEAVVEASIFPLAVLLIPMHPFAFALFMVWQITFNVAGHTGYEFYPRWLLGTWFGRVINTPTNHIMHHETMRGNYGLYFNFWDRWMKTNHRDYEKRFLEVTTRKDGAKRAPALSALGTGDVASSAS